MDVLEIVLRALIAILAVIAFARINGLRSFSKMSSFDFALTIAMGSLLATTIINIDRDLKLGLAALAAIFAIQAAISFLRRKFDGFQKLADNEPLLLVRDGEILSANMASARITQSDLYGKLREANVLSMNQVRAVVLETTGDISVLHSKDPEGKLQPELIGDVRTAPR